MQKTELPSPLSTSSIGLAEFKHYSAAWLMDCEIRQHSPNTLSLRRGIVSKFIWWMETKQKAVISNLTMREFLLYVDKGNCEPGGRWGNPAEIYPSTPATVQLYHRHLRACLNWIIAEGGLLASPMANVKAPIDRADQIQPFTQDQVLAVLAAAKNTTHPRRDYAICLFLLDTGLRVSEVCNLRYGHLDIMTRSATVEGKGGKKRAVSYGAQTARTLWSYFREQNHAADTRLFLADRGEDTGEGLTRSGMGQLLSRLGEDAGLQNVRCSPHTFRHTFAVNFLRNGGNQFTLMAILGHTNVTMTRRYVEFAQADVALQQRIHSPVDAILKKKRGA
jgi:integrase/recombinase XerC